MLHERLPGISESACVFSGVDVTRQPTPVLPTAHYCMGGIPANYHGEAIRPTDGNPDATVPGLMAVGEAACVSVHGANRLGCNSLLDIVVFGRAAALRCAEKLTAKAAQPELPSDAGDATLARFDSLRNAKGGTPTPVLRLEMQRAMQTYATVFRTGSILQEGKQALRKVWNGVSDIAVSDRSMIWNSDLLEILSVIDQSKIGALQSGNTPGIGARLPTYLFTTRNSAMMAAWLVVIEYNLHIAQTSVRGWRGCQANCSKVAAGRRPALAHLRQRSRLARSCTKVVGGCFIAARSTSLGVLHRAHWISSQGKPPLTA